MQSVAYCDRTTLGSSREPSSAGRGQALALTILHHPDISRVGHVAIAGADPTKPQPWEVSRSAPEFFAPGALKGACLDDPFVSRTPFVLQTAPGPALEGQAPDKARLEIDGRAVRGSFSLDPDRLARGVVLNLADRVALLLHLLPDLPRAEDPLGLIGSSAALASLRADIRRVADRPIPVLIRGETGSGKELVARALHRLGPRPAGPFVAVNLGAIPASLMSSELFGHVAGAFTGARQSTSGHFLRAQGGTLFLDEVAEMPLESQAVLLRVLEDNALVPLGGAASVRLDVRVLAATDANLESSVSEGRFRGPLHHRLAGYTIQVPPLRARRDDIGRLVAFFLEKELQELGQADRLHRPPEERPWLPARTVAAMAMHDWPGNVRQLANVVRQIAIGSRNNHEAVVPPGVFGSQEPPEPTRPVIGRPAELSDDDLLRALQHTAWSTARAARLLGVSRTTLYALIDKSARIRKARDISGDELRTCLRECEGDVLRSAERLMVSDRALKLRMKELGIDADAR